nr:hypothetical protein [Mesorhizobium sp. LNJC398B00]
MFAHLFPVWRQCRLYRRAVRLL